MNNVELLRELLEAGGDPTTSDVRGWTPLHFAAQEHAVESARLLLQAGADVDARDEWGNTPLWVATFNSKGRGDMIALLLDTGAGPDTANSSGRTPRELGNLIGNDNVAQYFVGR